jgi:hypothetical protein
LAKRRADKKRGSAAHATVRSKESGQYERRNSQVRGASDLRFPNIKNGRMLRRTRPRNGLSGGPAASNGAACREDAPRAAQQRCATARARVHAWLLRDACAQACA